MSVRFVVLRVLRITDHPGSSSFVVMPFRFGISTFRCRVSSFLLDRLLSEAIIRIILHDVLLNAEQLKNAGPLLRSGSFGSAVEEEQGIRCTSAREVLGSYI